MPHISEKKLDEKYFNNLYSQLIKVFDTVGITRTSDLLLRELFTETEKIMFSKRLAIICLLSEGVSKPYICDLLLVSPSTVSRVSLQHEIGSYKYLDSIIKKNSRTIWEVLENIVHDSVSKQVGKRRMKWMDKLEDKYNKKIFK